MVGSLFYRTAVRGLVGVTVLETGRWVVSRTFRYGHVRVHVHGLVSGLERK